MEENRLEDIQSNSTIQTEIPDIKKGLTAAIIFGLVGAFIWAIIVKETGYNLGIVAILVGYLISQGFVWAGRNNSPIWGYVAAVIATLSIFLGKMFSVIIMVAEFYDITVLQMMQALDYGQLMRYMVETFEAFDLVFYAIAIQTAYKRSFIKAMPKLDNMGFDTNTQTNPKLVVTPESEAR